MVKKTVEIETRVTGDSQAKSKLGSLGSFIKSKLVITLGDIVRIGKGVINFFNEASKKAQEQEAVVNKLNQSLKTQGIYTAQTSKALQEQASALQKLTTFGDEAIISLQSQLIAFGVLPKDIERVTTATLDLAVSQGMDLNSAGNLLAKSLGSSTNALARYGIEITGAVGSSERLDTAITNISTKFGGQATAETETMRGATAQLNNTWGDLQETIMTTNNNAITPYIKGLNDILLKTNELIMGKSPLEQSLDDANKIRKELGWADKALEDYTETTKTYGGVNAEISAFEDKRLTRKEKQQRKEQQQLIEQLGILEGIVLLEKQRADKQAKQEEQANKLAEAEKKRLEAIEQQKQQDNAYSKMMIASRDAMIAKDIEVKMHR